MGIVARITRRLILIGGLQFPDPDFADAAQVPFRPAGQDSQAKVQVTTWPAYNESLRQRGDLTVWVSDEALCLWVAPRRTSRGGQPKYSDLAITLCLTLRVVYGLALRQTHGLMRSVAALMGFDIAVPDFSTLSRRSKGLVLPSIKSRTKTSGPIHLVVDSTGLKIFGEGEWLENKHKTKPKRKRWRKLYLGLDLASGEIVCSDLTTDDVGDPTSSVVRSEQIGGAPNEFIADGAYDGAPTRDLLAEGCDSAETQSSTFRQSENRSQDRRLCSQPDDQTRPTGMQARCMNNAVCRVKSHPILSMQHRQFPLSVFESGIIQSFKWPDFSCHRWQRWWEPAP